MSWAQLSTYIATDYRHSVSDRWSRRDWHSGRPWQRFCQCRPRTGFRFLSLFPLLPLFIACTPPPAGPDLSTLLAQQRQARHQGLDLADARILLDFREDRQTAAFRFETFADSIEALPSHPPRLAAAPHSAAGDLALNVSLAPEQLLTLNFSQLPADAGNWGDFSSLLISLNASDATTIELALHAGRPDAPSWEQQLDLQPGWNHLRLNLNEPRRFIDLSAIREITWRLPPGAPAVELFLDDFLLAERPRELHDLGSLRIIARGGQLVVIGRGFELAFERGVIAGWYAAGPANLVWPTGLGPWQVPLWEEGSVYELGDLPPPQFALGETARGPSAHRPEPGLNQRIVEASPLRVIIEGSGRRGVPSHVTTAADLWIDQTWRYTIYPDGRAYVGTTTHIPPELPAPLGVGQAVVLSPPIDPRLVSAASASAYDEKPAPLVMLVAAEPASAAFCWIAANPAAQRRQRLLQHGDNDPIVILTGDAPADALAGAAHLLWFLPRPYARMSALHTLQDVYQYPLHLQPQPGEIVTDATGDWNRDGFNESEGVYELRPHRGMLRLQIAAPVEDLPPLLFRVWDTVGKRCWLQVDGAVLPDPPRDAAGNVLLGLDPTSARRRFIEAYITER